MKRLTGQIHVIIHALGILLCLPHILEKGEIVEYVSLGAGNTGRSFDLETNRRIAEFKFISWQSGSETIRQNAIFKDMFELVRHVTEKRKYLYVLGSHYPIKFLKGGRSLESVLSRNTKLKQIFEGLYGGKFKRVRDWYAAFGDGVAVVDVSPWLSELAGDLIQESIGAETLCGLGQLALTPNRTHVAVRAHHCSAQRGVLTQLPSEAIRCAVKLIGLSGWVERRRSEGAVCTGTCARVVDNGRTRRSRPLS